MSSGLFGLSGYPVQRDPSQVVTSNNEYGNQIANISQGFANQAAALPQAMTPEQYVTMLQQPVAQNYQNMFDAAGFNLGPGSLNMIQGALANDFNGSNLDQAYASVGGKDNFDAWNAYSNQGYGQAQNQYRGQLFDINQQLQQADAQAAAASQARETNRVAQQNAYSGQLGGGATGGLLSNWNGLAGGSPTSTVQPGSQPPTTQSAWGGSGLMGGNGFGGGGASSAAPTTAQTWSSTGQATQPPASNLGMGSWGGPFSAKNPWSLS